MSLLNRSLHQSQQIDSVIQNNNSSQYQIDNIEKKVTGHFRLPTQKEVEIESDSDEER